MVQIEGLIIGCEDAYRSGSTVNRRPGREINRGPAPVLPSVQEGVGVDRELGRKPTGQEERGKQDGEGIKDPSGAWGHYVGHLVCLVRLRWVGRFHDPVPRGLTFAAKDRNRSPEQRQPRSGGCARPTPKPTPPYFKRLQRSE